jgi:hypothetical protein
MHVFLDTTVPGLLSSAEKIEKMSESELLCDAGSPARPDGEKIRKCCRESEEFKAFISSYALELADLRE